MKDCMNCLYYETCYYVKRLFQLGIYRAIKGEGLHFAEVCKYYKKKEDKE